MTEQEKPANAGSSDTSACWIWEGEFTTSGYGIVRHDNSTCRAHRYMYESFRGPIPEGLMVLHSCDNRACVNPWHLRVGTHAENMRDMVIRHRSPSGGRNARAKISLDDAVSIIKMVRSGHTQKYTGIRFGISQNMVSEIVLGKSWRRALEIANAGVGL